MVRVVVDKQAIWTDTTRVVLVEGSINFMRFEFDFSDDWDGYVKVAQFTQGGSTYNQALADNACYLPAEIKEGLFFLSVFGVDGSSSRGSTAQLVLHAMRSGFAAYGSTPIPPTPDLYDQLVTRMRAVGAEIYDWSGLRMDIPGAIAVPEHDELGRIVRIVHTDQVSGGVVRTDVVSYSDSVITEVRTLATGARITYRYDMETLEVTASQIEGGTEL